MTDNTAVREMKAAGRGTLAGRVLGIPEVGVLIPLVLLVVVVTILRPNFLGGANLQAMFRALAFWGIVAIGETLVMLVGEIDISVGSVAAMCGMLAAFLTTEMHMGIVAGVALALLAGCAAGFVNGFSVVKLKVPAFITTIAMLYIGRGIARALTGGRVINSIPEPLAAVGTWEPFGTSVTFIVFIVLMVVFEFILRRTVYGRQLYATGDNREVARMAGIRVDVIKISTYVITGLLTAIAGVLLTAQMSTGNPANADGWELSVVAACAIGGVSLIGGAGSMLGTFLGILVMAGLNNSLVLLSINSFVQNVLLGVLMILAVYADIIRRRRKLGS